MRAPEGWPRLQRRAPPLTLRRAALAVGREGEWTPAPTWPEGAKGRQPAPWRVTVPGGQPTERLAAIAGCRPLGYRRWPFGCCWAAGVSEAIWICPLAGHEDGGGSSQTVTW